MPVWIARNPSRRPPDESVLEAEIARALHPFSHKPGDLNRLRERLMDTMWDDIGVIRDAAGIDRGIATLADIEAELLATGIPASDLRFDLTWHDWLNLRSLVEVSAVIARAAKARENSRGAHFRADFPAPGEMAASWFTVARQQSDRLTITQEPVRFTHVRPGETLLTAAAE
jgi:fumarate reductase flavoprotein subunit